MNRRVVPPAAIPDVDGKCHERLRRARLHTGMSRELILHKVSEILEEMPYDPEMTKEPKLLTDRTYRDWESGKTRVQLGRRFRALATVLGQAPGWLSLGEGEFYEFDPASSPAS